MATVNASESEAWTVSDSLILVSFLQHVAQPNWTIISAQMMGHPLIHPSRKHLFTPERCEQQLQRLINMLHENDRTRLSLPDLALLLIEILRKERIQQAKQQIANIEAEIRQHRNNIQAIRRGEWDSILLAKTSNKVVQSTDAMSSSSTQSTMQVGVQTPSGSSTDLQQTSQSNPAAILEQILRPQPPPTPEQIARMKQFIKRLMGHKLAALFKQPVTKEEAPEYADIILKPIDLSLIKSRIESGEIATKQQLQRDLLHMFANALLFNPKGTEVYNTALIFRDFAMKEFDKTFGGVTTRSRKR